MKKIQILTALLLSISIASYSQSAKRQSSSHSQILKLGVNTFFDTDEFPFSISWETKLAANESIQIGFLPRVRSFDNDKTNGIGINLAYRKYISKNRTGINGLFISPTVKVGYLKDENSYTYYYSGNPPQYIPTKNTNKITQFSTGFVFGHNWVFRSGFSIEASGGMSYFNTTNKNTSINNNIQTNATYKESGITPHVQLSFGYAF